MLGINGGFTLTERVSTNSKKVGSDTVEEGELQHWECEMEDRKVYMTWDMQNTTRLRKVKQELEYDGCGKVIS